MSPAKKKAASPEDQLYAAMTKGDWEAVEAMWADGSDEEYHAAHARYQADHDTPERDRMKATKAAVKAENATAQRASEDAEEARFERERESLAAAAALAAASSDNRDRPED